MQDDGRWVTDTDDFVAIKLLLPTCRSNKSPKGVAPFNHLCDGTALLVLVRRCNQLQYAQFLFELSQVGACKGRFPFVDLIDVTAMQVEPIGEESSWNVDGELLEDNRVSVQVLRLGPFSSRCYFSGFVCVSPISSWVCVPFTRHSMVADHLLHRCTQA